MVGYNLYFSSGHYHYLPGWQGLTDIFSIRWDGQEWIDFINMGAPINSPYYDESPCMMPDGNTIYVIGSSDSLTDFDILVSHWVPTSIEDSILQTPVDDFKINIYPNPFNTTCKIILNSIAINENIQVRIINILGKEVKDLGQLKLHNTRTIIWDGTNNYGFTVTSGVYFAVLEHDNNKVAKKMILLK